MVRLLKLDRQRLQGRKLKETGKNKHLLKALNLTVGKNVKKTKEKLE
jgi:hypothetical protein